MSDIDKHPKIFRLLQLLPGLLTWVLILSPIWLVLLRWYSVLAFYVLFLSVYWLYKSFSLTFGIWLGHKYYRRDMAIDWEKELRELNFKKLPNSKELPGDVRELYYLIVIPFYKEGREILEPTIKALLNSTFNSKQIMVALGVEERAGQDSLKLVQSLQKKYSGKFMKFWYFVHPADIKGEAKGVAGANRRWIGIHAVKKIKEMHIDPKHVIMLTFDCDLQVHPKFLSAIAYLYVTTPNRLNYFFTTGIYLLTNNYWQVPAIVRAQSLSLSLGTMQVWALSPAHRETFSVYAASLQTLIDANYWDASVGIDDTYFYWNVFFIRHGYFHGKCVYIPTYSDAVSSKSYIATHKALYKQMFRWGWGAIVVPLSFYKMLFDKAIPFNIKVVKSLLLLQAYVFWITVSFLITFAMPIAGIASPEFKHSVLMFNVSTFTSVLLTIALTFLIPVKVISEKFLPSRPTEWKWWRKMLTFFDPIFSAISIMVFHFLPNVHAQTEIMLKGGFRKNYYATEKNRKGV